MISATLFSLGVTAESAIGNVSVRLITPVVLEELSPVDFGAQSSQNGICNMSSGGSLSGSSSTCTQQGQLGTFKITGEEDQSVSISVSAGEADSGVSFSPALVSDANPVLTGGEVNALIGGSLILDDAVTGTYNLFYTIIVNYN